MTFRMIVQLWNTNTPAIVSRDADLTAAWCFNEFYNMGVRVFCLEVVFNCSCFRSVCCNCYHFYEYNHFNHVIDEPTNLACTSPDSTTLTFTWTLPAGGAGVVQGYHLDMVRTDGIKVDVVPVRLLFR